MFTHTIRNNGLARRILCILLCLIFLLPFVPFSARADGPAGSSEYKHISHTGAPYNIDAITGATLTVEGPGVVSSIPISVRELEETPDSYIHSGVYTDLRVSGSTSRTYEGVKVLSILDGLVNSNVQKLDDNVVVIFKNRWRNDVARMTYNDIKNASAPVILAYGAAYSDGTDVKPFVFNMGAGSDSVLGNEDGPLKLVYNQGASPSGPFSSVAYMYIEEGSPPPGFSHIGSTDQAYKNPTNTEYILTFTGGALGREVNYTVADLETMAAVNPALVHRDEYSLSNTTYWYVNEYEGLNLWELLKKMGLPASRGNEENTLVSFSSWDNYQISTQFSLYQLAHPELFYFYEKSPLDIGTDRPTKAQLATAPYQPTDLDLNSPTGMWTRDSNGYPVKKTGYPVLLAYGVNSYPYVRDTGLAGYKSGLGNSGGPMRLIYAKTDGLTRSDPDAEENYAYFYNNGSQQLQRVQEVYVGDSTRYSTHLENPGAAYRDMKDSPAALTVEINIGGSTRTETFTLAELESILYGPGVSKRDRDLEGRQEKGYYFYRTNIEDLFEGLNLNYLLTKVIGLQGRLGTMKLYSGADASPTAIYDLADISSRGGNNKRGTNDLGMTVAFAKNGYPLVAGSGNGSANNADPLNASYIPGYVHNDGDTGLAIRNIGGPLVFVRGQNSVEAASGAGTIEANVNNKTYVSNLTKIVVELDPDAFAHVGPANEVYANHSVAFSGAITVSGGISRTVGSLEMLQQYMVTDSYTVGDATNIYRGLDLYKLLNDKSIGAGSLMNEVVVKNGAGDSKTLTVADLTSSGKKILLAYGFASAADLSDAAPLTPATGGPMRLIIDGGTGAECIVNVSEIVVGAASISAWKHNFGQYELYAGYKLEITGQNLVNNKTYTVAEIEAMDNIITQGEYKVGSNTFVVQGVELHKLLQNIGFTGGADTSVFTAYASDGYSVQFSGSQLKDGINGKPVLIAFGQGTTALNGRPLVPVPTSAGYDAIALNDGGPLRLIIHDNSGWSVKLLARIVVGAAGGNPGTDPLPKIEFSLYPGGINGMPQASVRAVVTDSAGGLWVGTNGAGAVYISPAGVITGYDINSTPALKTNFVTGLAIAPDGSVWLTQGGSVGSQNTAASEHYGFARFYNGQFTFYDSSSPGSTLPSNCVYSIDVDKSGIVWVTSQHTTYGAEGGLTRFDPATGLWRSWKMADGLPTTAAWAVKCDDKGGAWVTTYQTSNNPGAIWSDKSYAHISANGSLTAYTIPDGTNFTWSRSIAVAPNGGGYITRMSGAHDPSNDGGWLDYIAPDGSLTTYKGDDLIAELKAGARQGFYPEIRTVFVDGAGYLWLSTNGLGVYKCSAANGVITVLDNYSSDTQCWPAGAWNDVWSICVSPDGTAYFGSNGGVAFAKVGAPSDITNPGTDPQPGYIGDATADTADLTITGAVEKPGYFTLAGLKNYPRLTERTREYDWLNSVGTRGRVKMKGVYLEDLLTKVMNLSPNAASITVTAGYGDNIYERSFNLDSNELGVFWTDKSGNKLMLAWQENDTTLSGFRLIVGQTGPDHVNRPMWVNDVHTITVNAHTVTPGGGTPGKTEGTTGTPGSGEPTETVTVNIDADVDVKDGVVNASNTTETIREALDSFKTEAAAKDGAKKLLQVDAATEDETYKTIYTLPEDALSLLVKDGKTCLELLTDQGSMLLDPGLLKYLEDAGKGAMVIGLAKTDAADDLAAFELDVLRGDKPISDFGNNLLKLKIPVSPDASKRDEDPVVCFVDENGQKTLLKLAAYDPDSGMMKIGVKQTGKYIVDYSPKTFADVQGHWAQKYIGFLASRNIVNGYPGGGFNPQGNVTRAEFLKMLAEAVDGIDFTGVRSAGFNDLADGAWYIKYVDFAAALGIVNGYPDGSFRPNGLITREEMAVMTERFIKAMGFNLMTVNKATEFKDQDKISLYAVDAVKVMQQYGILDGNPDGSFNPKGYATRAEAAKVICAYILGVVR